jgi:hypothetical protein
MRSPVSTRKQKLRGALLRSIISTAFLLTACIPLPRSDSGITDHQLSRIVAGETTSSEVEAILGRPTIIWESERVWVYEQGPSGAFLWVVPGGYTAAIFLMELGEDVVIMRFNEQNEIQRMDRRVGPLLRRNYGEFLREWLADQGNGNDWQSEITKSDTEE